MKRLILLLIVGSVISPSPSLAQDRGNPQGVIVSQLRSGTFDERYEAVQKAITIPINDRTPQLWRALVGELKRTLADRDRPKITTESSEAKAEYLGDLIQALAWCPDPEAIQPLVSLIDTGAMATDTLARFGETAARPVIEVAGDPSAEGTKVSGALLTLQKMQQQPVRTPLSADSRRAIVGVTRRILDKGHPNPAVLGRAAATGAATHDPELLVIVEDLARQPGEVAKRGITTPGGIDLVQKLAAEGLAAARGRQRPK